MLGQGAGPCTRLGAVPGTRFVRGKIPAWCKGREAPQRAGVGGGPVPRAGQTRAGWAACFKALFSWCWAGRGAFCITLLMASAAPSAPPTSLSQQCAAAVVVLFKKK